MSAGSGATDDTGAAHAGPPFGGGCAELDAGDGCGGGTKGPVHPVWVAASIAISPITRRVDPITAMPTIVGRAVTTWARQGRDGGDLMQRAAAREGGHREATGQGVMNLQRSAASASVEPGQCLELVLLAFLGLRGKAVIEPSPCLLGCDTDSQ